MARVRADLVRGPKTTQLQGSVILVLIPEFMVCGILMFMWSIRSLFVLCQLCRFLAAEPSRMHSFLHYMSSAQVSCKVQGQEA